jgi:hypothetical protein
MRGPRFRLRTTMILVAVAAMILCGVSAQRRAALRQMAAYHTDQERRLLQAAEQGEPSRSLRRSSLLASRRMLEERAKTLADDESRLDALRSGIDPSRQEDRLDPQEDDEADRGASHNSPERIWQRRILALEDIVKVERKRIPREFQLLGRIEALLAREDAEAEQKRTQAAEHSRKRREYSSRWW